MSVPFISLMMKKKWIGLLAFGLSIAMFFITESTIQERPAAVGSAIEEALRTEIQAAAVSGQYHARALPMPKSVEQVCFVNSAVVDTTHVLCQMERLCSQWKNKEANVFFLPSGDFFLIEGLVPANTAECFPIVDGKLFFTLKQKNGQIVIE